MREPERGRRFEFFCRMRLEGLNDLEYRAYDLLSHHNRKKLRWDMKTIIRYAGLEHNIGTTDHQVYSLLQQKFMQWGYGIVPHSRIEILLREFYIWHRIKYRGWTWAERPPLETRFLYDQQETNVNHILS